MNRTLSAMTLMMTAAATGCMSGDGSDIGLAAQPIVPGISTTCASGSFEGNTTPQADPTAPWTQVEGSSTASVRAAAGQFIVEQAGGSGVAYTRVEPRAAGATSLSMDANVAIRPDALSPADGCPSVPVANIGIVVSDGTRMAGLAVGRMVNSAGVETNYVALRALDRCATPIAVAPFRFDITEFHVYSLRLDPTGATLFIDKESEPALRVAYDRLDAATSLHGAQYGFRTEHAVATWDYVRVSGCGVPSTPVAPPVSSCTGMCPGNHPPSCLHAAASQASLWPPNHSFRPERVIGLTDSDGDEVSYTIDFVTSDEAVDAQGSGNTDDDVAREDLDQNEDGRTHVAGDGHSHGRGVEVRSERSGGGNGRVYALHVTADDGRGGSCQTTVRVCVPHDHSGDPCIDDGQIYVVSR